MLGIGAAGGLALATWAWGAYAPNSRMFGPVTGRGPRKRVAFLTFDDGPNPAVTELVLDVLAREGVPATFFMVGRHVERYPATARAVARAGHEIGNHSHTHPMLCFRSAAFMEAELRRAQDCIEARTGATPTLFRAPFGVRWFGIGGVQRRLRLTGVMWTIIGYDWSRKVDQVVERITQRTANGAILCLHDGRELRAKPDIGVTVETVQRLVPMLLDRGYSFKTVSQLLCPTI